MSVLIKEEQIADHAAIFALHAAAFPSDGEAHLVNALRANGDLRISFVAYLDDVLVGHVAISAMQAPANTLGLAPVATLPAHQNQGIAAQLIETAIQKAKQGGWDAVFVLGDPAYYGRFGFDVARADRFDSPYQGPAFAVLPLSNHWQLASGPATYAAPFGAL